MLSATTAYTRTRTVEKELEFKRSELLRKEIMSLELKINSMINQGKFQLEYDNISMEAIEVLKLHGYGVDTRQTGMNEWTYIIYWKPKEIKDEEETEEAN